MPGILQRTTPILLYSVVLFSASSTLHEAINSHSSRGLAFYTVSFALALPSPCSFGGVLSFFQTQQHRQSEEVSESSSRVGVGM